MANFDQSKFKSCNRERQNKTASRSSRMTCGSEPVHSWTGCWSPSNPRTAVTETAILMTSRGHHGQYITGKKGSAPSHPVFFVSYRRWVVKSFGKWKWGTKENGTNGQADLFSSVCVIYRFFGVCGGLVSLHQRRRVRFPRQDRSIYVTFSCTWCLVSLLELFNCCGTGH